MSFIDKILGNTAQSQLKKLQPMVNKINALEEEIHALTDEALRGKTAAFKARLAQGESLDSLLPEAYAVVREAAVRTIGQRHYDVQLIGGIVLHQGRIAEMKTGEGKTITETLPAYLNALSGHGVHIVTVNDYLASRDAQWMGKIYRFLGLTVGCIVHDMNNDARREAYGCDITYGTNNELGFDYLRDNMVVYKDQMVQRELHYAIVDEVDSILIDSKGGPVCPQAHPGRKHHQAVQDRAAYGGGTAGERGLYGRYQGPHRGPDPGGYAQGGTILRHRGYFRHGKYRAQPPYPPGPEGPRPVPAG